MTSKHTPGPWTLGTNVYQPNHIEAADPLMRGRNNLVRIAETFEIAPDNNQHEANAHLIAAAPELLECLKDARSKLSDPNAIDLAYIDEVISKAEGSASRSSIKQEG